MTFIKKHIKDFIYITLILVLFSMTISLFCIKTDNSKVYLNDWTEVYGITYNDSTMSNCRPISRNIVSEDSINGSGIKFNAKKILIKKVEENNTRYLVIKYIDWDNKEEIEQVQCGNIMHIEYL